MNKSKLTLIVDGNWLLMSRLSVIANKYIGDEELCANLQLLMTRSIKLVLKQFPLIDNIIFIADGGSWRNDLAIPEYLKDDEGNPITYKGNREKSEDINWDAIFASYEEFIEILKQNGINTYREKGIEGDDWAWWWSTYLNSQGTNCIIWTKDNDLKQLVNIDSNKCFTVWWNKENGLYADQFNDSDMNFLFNNEFNVNDDIFNKLIASVKYQQINKNDIILDKIIRGDLGDNILPIITKKTTNKDSTRIYRISNKEIDNTLDFRNDAQIQNYINELCHSKKYAGKITMTPEIAFDHFKYNRRLVVLSKESYPQEILNIFENYKEYNLSNNIYIVENKLVASTNRLDGILNII